MYTSLERLRDTVVAHGDRDDMRTLFEYHSERVAGLLASQPDVPASETTIAGFLNGFRTAATALAEDPHLAADTMHPQLGGIYLFAVETLKNHSPDQADDPDPRQFFARLTETLRDEPVYLGLTDPERVAAQEMVRGSFAETPDVPVNAASLAGFVLGLLYATPFVAERAIPTIVALMGAAKALVPREP